MNYFMLVLQLAKDAPNLIDDIEAIKTELSSDDALKAKFTSILGEVDKFLVSVVSDV